MDDVRTIEFVKKWLELGGVGAPSSDPTRVYGFANLIRACGAHFAPQLVEAFAGFLIRQTQKIQNPLQRSLKIINPVVEANLVDLQWQDCQPMIHQLLVLADIPPEIAEIVGVRMIPEEAKLKDRETGVTRIALAQNDARAGQQRRDEAEMKRIAGHLVGDVARAGRELVQIHEVLPRRDAQARSGETGGLTDAFGLQHRPDKSAETIVQVRPLACSVHR